MNRKTRVHDGTVGAVIAAGTALGIWANPAWFWLSGIVGLAMVQSAFTGFCPVYYTLDKIGIAEDPPGASQAV